MAGLFARWWLLGWWLAGVSGRCPALSDSISRPAVALRGVPFDVQVGLVWTTWPEHASQQRGGMGGGLTATYTVLAAPAGSTSKPRIIHQGTTDLLHRQAAIPKTRGAAVETYVDTLLLRHVEIDGDQSGGGGSAFFEQLVASEHDITVLFDPSTDTDLDNCPPTSIAFTARLLDGKWSLAPTFVTLLSALLTRRVVPSMIVGVASGSMLVHGYNPVTACLSVFDHYMIAAITYHDHAKIILFSLVIATLVELIQTSGAARSLSRAVLSRAINTSTRGQLLTWLCGLAICFDDYANALLLGNALRDITDPLQISHAKLSFLVDSTGATVASLFPFSTWVGFEISLIAHSFADLGVDLNAQEAFWSTLPQRFYPINVLIFSLAIAASGRDFGRMRASEERARPADGGKPELGLRTDDYKPEFITSLQWDKTVGRYRTTRRVDNNTQPTVEAPWYLAVCPFVVLVCTIMLGLFIDGCTTTDPTGRTMEYEVGHGKLRNGHAWGKHHSYTPAQAHTDWHGTAAAAAAAAVAKGPVPDLGGMAECFGADGPAVFVLLNRADSLKVQIWASIAGLTTALSLHIWHGGKFGDVSEAAFTAIKKLSRSLLVLMLAWSLGIVVSQMQMSGYVVSAVHVTPDPDVVDASDLLPAIVFAMAAFSSFSTGSSWATMAVMFPAVVEMAWILGGEQRDYMIRAISSILAGSIFGDHISPISDTTVLSAATCQVSLREHVQTQFPYAAVCAMVSLAMSALSAYLPLYVCHATSAVTLFAVVGVFGTKVRVFKVRKGSFRDDLEARFRERDDSLDLGTRRRSGRLSQSGPMRSNSNSASFVSATNNLAGSKYQPL